MPSLHSDFMPSDPDEEFFHRPAGQSSAAPQTKSRFKSYYDEVPAAHPPGYPAYPQGHVTGYGLPFSGYGYGSGQMVPYGMNPFAPGPAGGTKGGYFGGQESYYGAGYGPYGGPWPQQQYLDRPQPPPPREKQRLVNPYRQSRTKVNVPPQVMSHNTGDAVWNPASKRDMTIHLELDIEEDIESKIAEVASLQRMGRFREAHAYFKANLSAYLDDSIPVMAEYADMLLAQGYFDLIFKSFDDDAITELCLMARVRSLAAEEVNFALILQLARSYSDPNLETAHSVAQMASKFWWLGLGLLEARPSRHSHERIDSTELQVLCHYLHLDNYIRANSNLWAADFGVQVGWQQWVGLYRNLVDESRHWELRDTVVAFVSTFGAHQTCASLLGEGSVKAGVSKLLDDWDKTMPTEISGSYLLDIMVCFCKKGFRTEAPAHMVKFLLQRGRAVAASVKEKNQESVKWRPYLEWILLEEKGVRLHRSHRDGQEGSTASTMSPVLFGKLPGSTVWADELPIYAPTASENPGWPPATAEKGAKLSDELLRVVLCVTEELGDFATQVSCLRELICRSRDPANLLAELRKLQLSLMGDKLGALKTTLTEYLLTPDDESRRS